jgi:ribosomal protein L11 methyltransferase
LSKKPDWERPGTGLWRAVVTVPDVEMAASVMDAFSDLTAVSAFEEPGGGWCVEGFTTDEPERGAVSSRLALAMLPFACTVAEPVWQKLPPKDWLNENQAAFPPLAVGRYFIHGSHFDGVIPPGRIGLLIDAATAFGTGEHATTRGCLLALDAIAAAGCRPLRILDMGTGTGVLAMAAAKTWRRRVVARDIDPESVRVTVHNARYNGVARLMSVRKSDGYHERGVAKHGPYDLIFANILAGPLERMAADLSRVLAPGGVAVLSGLLSRQANGVLAAHRLQRLRLKQQIVIDGWSTLVLAHARPAHLRSIRKRASS